MTFVESTLTASPQACAPNGSVSLSFTAARDGGVMQCEWAGAGMVTTPCAVTLGSPWWSGTGTWIAPDAGPGFQLVTVRFKNFAGTVLGSASTQVKLIPELQASIVVPGINSAVSSMSPSGEPFFATSTSSQVSLFAVRGSSIVDAGVLVAPGAPGSLAFPSGRPTFSASTTNQGPFVMELTGQQPESQGAPNDGWVFAQSLPLNFTYPAPELFAVADGGLFALVRTNIVADPAQNSIELYRRTDAGWRAANSSDGGFLSLARGLRTRLGSYQGSPLAYFTFPDGGQQVGALHFTGNLAEQDGTPNDGWEFLGSPLSFSEPIGVLAHTLDAQGRPTLLAMGSGFDAKTWVSRFDGSWQPIGLGSIVDASPNGADLLGLPDGGFLAAIAARRPTLSDAVTVYQYTGDLTETEAVPHDGWIQLTLPTPIVSPRLHRNPVTGEVLLVGIGLAAPGQNGVLIYRLP